MGGLTFVFAGDFCQALSVILKGTKADITEIRNFHFTYSVMVIERSQMISN